MTGTHQEQLIDQLRVLLFLLSWIYFYMLWFQHTEDSWTQHLPRQHHHHLHHPEGEGSHRIQLGPALDTAERGCYRTLLDKLMATDIPGYRNFQLQQTEKKNWEQNLGTTTTWTTWTWGPDLHYFLLGDDAFALMPWMVKPYSRHQLTREERIANYKISRGEGWSRTHLVYLSSDSGCCWPPWSIG